MRIFFRNRDSKEDKKTLYFITFIIYFILLATFFLYYFNIGLYNSKILAYIGFAILLFGFALRQWAVHILGNFFVPVVKIQKKQKVIEKGVYKYIRHPSYTGLLLELIGFSLALKNLLGVFLIFVLFLPAILYRIKIEEDFLCRNLEGYKDYMKRTWRFVPFVY